MQRNAQNTELQKPSSVWKPAFKVTEAKLHKIWTLDRLTNTKGTSVIWLRHISIDEDIQSGAVFSFFLRKWNRIGWKIQFIGLRNIAFVTCVLQRLITRYTSNVIVFCASPKVTLFPNIGPVQARAADGHQRTAHRVLMDRPHYSFRKGSLSSSKTVAVFF